MMFHPRRDWNVPNRTWQLRKLRKRC